MTDPRAALADDLSRDIWHLGTDWSEYRRDLVREGVRRAAERGVLLVTEERLAAAIARIMRPADAVNAAAIFAALQDG